MKGIGALLLAAFLSVACAQNYRFDVAAYSVSEDTGVLTICLRRTGSVSAAVTIFIESSTGTATGGTDYTPSFPTEFDADSENGFVFTSGSTVACRQITIVDDGNNENAETFTLSIQGDNAGNSVNTENPSSTVVTITDDDDDEEYEWEDSSYTVNENGGSVSVCMIRSGSNNPSRTIYVDYGGTASSSDYSSVSSWTFSTNSNRECRSISITNDNLYEGSETITIDITDDNNSGLNIGSPSRTTITIDDNDDDLTYYWSQSSYTVAENVGAVSVCMRRSSTGSSARTVQVSYSSGTATLGVDFNPGNTQFYFASGDTEDCNSITIVNDDNDENTETFTAQILNTGNVGTINIGSPSVATISITDDDDDVEEFIGWSAAAYTFSEASGTVSVTITKTGGTSLSTTATVQASSGTATAGVDFSLPTTTISIPAGSTSTTVSISIINDSTDENNESFTLLLSGATNGVGISQSTAVVTITDNDDAEEEEEDDGLTDGEIAGIVIGSVLGALLIVILILLLCCFLMPNNPCAQLCSGLLGGPPAPQQPQPGPVVYQGYPGYPGYPAARSNYEIPY